jgi:signal peptidase I
MSQQMPTFEIGDFVLIHKFCGKIDKYPAGRVGPITKVFEPKLFKQIERGYRYWVQHNDVYVTICSEHELVLLQPVRPRLHRYPLEAF